MLDTNPLMAAKTREMMMEKSREERLVIGCSMFSFARTIVLASILRKNSNISPGDLKRELFLRFYGNDMNKDALNRIALQFASSQ
ncbi:MAG: hypothetical protein K8S62_00785 [Candidatus Sabulitectum sp.]|nr:hypothetical protein [Candidatus Sabulitectum sp.]